MPHTPEWHLQCSPEVEAALRAGRPVVALESTIISHGMPYPQNLQTAQQVEAVVRQHGATPATIAILHGRIRIGLASSELETLAKAGTDCVKVSRRDIAVVQARQVHGATTVAATMLLAHAAGVPVFVTGGIGGVHRGAETTFDISADLTELGRTPVAVVCAGAKSVRTLLLWHVATDFPPAKQILDQAALQLVAPIWQMHRMLLIGRAVDTAAAVQILDIPKTLEVLETQGVAVVGYQCDDFPAFFTRNSGCRAHVRVDSVSECVLLKRLPEPPFALRECYTGVARNSMYL